MKSRSPSASVSRRPRRFRPRGVAADQLWLYRDFTLAMLHRYFRLSLEHGRLPSLLGREFFRTRVTSSRIITFEDSIIFVHDMERCLERLRPFARRLIAHIVFQDYTQEEAARLLGCTRQTVAARMLESLDELSAILLDCGLLRPLAQPPRRANSAPRDCGPPPSLTIAGTATGSVASPSPPPAPLVVPMATATPPYSPTEKNLSSPPEGSFSGQALVSLGEIISAAI